VLLVLPVQQKSTFMPDHASDEGATHQVIHDECDIHQESRDAQMW
jgi:hypothetical protein